LIHPANYLENLSKYRDNKKFFKPSVIAVSEVVKNTEYLIQVAYIGRIDTNEHVVSSIVYIGATYNHDSVFRLTNPTRLLTLDWKIIKYRNIKYHIPKGRHLNISDAKKSDSFNRKISKLLNIPIISFDYYSCKNREQVYRILGYHFIQDMYLTNNKFGLTNSYSKQIFATNYIEFYAHEICHLYLNKLIDSTQICSSIIEEGAATFFGGSVGYSIEHHLKNLSIYISNHRNFSFENLLKRGEVMINNETNLSKALGGLMVKIVWERKGLSGLKKLLSTQEEEIIEQFGYIINVKCPDSYLIDQALKYRK
jgi:hypothetical protein